MAVSLLVTACAGPGDLSQQGWWRHRCENTATLIATGAKHEGRCAPRETMELRPHDDGTLVVCTCPKGLAQ
jgi:hypothetical protein